MQLGTFHIRKKCEVKYNQNNLFESVFVVMGKDGIEEIVEIKLTYDEQKKFNTSCIVLKGYIEKVKTL